MAISEAARSDLYIGLVQVLGPKRAETLMSAIPLYDLDEVATKRDLQVLKAELQAEFTAMLGAEVGGLRRDISIWMLTQSVAIIGAILGVALLT